MEVESCVPPGFRFHPTEEELVGYYLTRKISSQRIDLQVITDIDLYKIEPWELQDRCRLGYEEQNEWYFFSHKDKKYPSGTRTNRATTAGFWKATGRDKAVVSKSKVIGMRKTLVFYQGRAPNGRKTDWIMHEYRLQTSELGPQEEGWVVCRAFKKPTSNTRQCFSTYNPEYFRRSHDYYEIDQMETDHSRAGSFTYESMLVCESLGNESNDNNTVFEIPVELHSPGFSSSLAAKDSFETSNTANDELKGQLIDWKVLDQLLTSQLCESALSSNLNPHMEAIDHYGMNDQNPVDHYLASFPNS